MRLSSLRVTPLFVIACSAWLGCSDPVDVVEETDTVGSSSSTTGASTSTGTTNSSTNNPNTTEPANTSSSTDSTSSNTDSTSSGSSTTGLEECDAGFYGSDCEGECGCVNGVCDDGRQGTGACTCDKAWSGEVCDTCAEGFFGEACTACACINGSCDDGPKGSGACECDEGWTGSICDHDCGDGMVNPDGRCLVLLEAVEDAFVCSDDLADTNMGIDQRTSRAVGQQNDFTGNQIGRLLLKFELSQIPEGAVVEASGVRLRQWDNFAGFPMDARLAEIPADWVEAAVTWNNQPTAGPSLGAQEIGCCGDDYDWDVGPTVATAIDSGETEVAYQLASDDEGTVGGLRWWMREGDGMDDGRAPRLLIRYAVP